ncbi:MAG: hypothetical protein UGF89_01600 [Acutalibacteraceae bacterium]|nr:hypothetical protein [Acutalibacteraceae bacterium]
MEVLFEEYGGFILAAIGGIAVLLIFIDTISSGGTLNQYIQDFLDSAC